MIIAGERGPGSSSRTVLPRGTDCGQALPGATARRRKSPNCQGRGSGAPPRVSGLSTTPDGRGSGAPPHVSGLSALPPDGRGSGAPPHVSGLSALPPDGRGSGAPPHVSGLSAFTPGRPGQRSPSTCVRFVCFTRRDPQGRTGIRQTNEMAEREGFEPSVPLRAQRFSRPPRSTTPAPLRMRGMAPLRGGAGR